LNLNVISHSGNEQLNCGKAKKLKNSFADVIIRLMIITSEQIESEDRVFTEAWDFFFFFKCGMWAVVVRLFVSSTYLAWACVNKQPGKRFRTTPVYDKDGIVLSSSLFAYITKVLRTESTRVQQSRRPYSLRHPSPINVRVGLGLLWRLASWLLGVPSYRHLFILFGSGWLISNFFLSFLFCRFVFI
jgi:hypothetical protein